MSISNFTIFLETEKRFSRHTIRAYTSDMQQFEDFLKLQYELTNPTEATVYMIKDWIAHLKEANNDNSSINRKISTIRTYFLFLEKNGLIAINPTEKIHALKTKSRVTMFVLKEDMQTYQALTMENNFDSIRNQLIIELLYQSGIRLSELISIKEGDIDFHTLTFKVTGKRNKQRVLPFQPSMKIILLDYINQKKKLFQENDYLILTSSGKKAYPSMIYKIVNEELKKITTLTKTSPHILRHTFATHLLNNGASLIAVKELLGHTSLAATQVYTHNSIEQLKKIHQQAHPKG